jgi:uncharacterized membrane protein YGL010W
MDVQTAVRTPTLQRYVERYSTSHQHKVNQRLHLVGIPLLTIAVLGLLARVRISTVDLPALLQPNLALAVMAFVCGWYLCLSPLAGALLLCIGWTCYVVGSSLTLPWLGGVAVLGAVLNKIGHSKFEGKSPAMYSRPIAVIEAPAWFLARLMGVEPLPDEAPSRLIGGDEGGSVTATAPARQSL